MATKSPRKNRKLVLALAEETALKLRASNSPDDIATGAKIAEYCGEIATYLKSRSIMAEQIGNSYMGRLDAIMRTTPARAEWEQAIAPFLAPEEQ